MKPDELALVATQFGVARAQVERDHLIAHLLGYLSAHFADRIVFIGGTALARTHLGENSNLMVVGTQRSRITKDTASPRHSHPRRWCLTRASMPNS